jgi:PAS domain S-box-containing protein
MSTPTSPDTADPVGRLEVLWQDSERVIFRAWREQSEGDLTPVLAVQPAAGSGWPDGPNRLAHEFALKDVLDAAWAVLPLALVPERNTLLLADRGGVPLSLEIGAPMDVGRFLRIGVALAGAVGGLHRSGLVHKDIKPGNIFVNSESLEVRLTGFGLASRVPRQRKSPVPPEVIAGTYAYMAPEQTGRMNRSIDARSDLYSLGVTLYEMLTGVLPFTAADPMEWVHCHIARQPANPAERVSGLPEPVCAIVMKLLSKGAEDRYQTAAGLQSDLQRCLLGWEASRHVAHFGLGAHDASNELLFREKLYGREAEIERLIGAFERVVTQGASGLVLVSGYSGIGKSSVVNELHRALVPPRGLYAAGKFDQYKRGIPYATLAQAFQGLVRQLLSKNNAELDRWRGALTQALGMNGRLMINLIPELALVIGEQPPVPDLSGPEAQSRFLLVFRQFLGVFAREEHPLVLVLDDLQWLDSATLAVFEDFATRPEVRHLLLVGVYRDNEVGPEHALARRLETIRESGAHVEELVLGAIRSEDIARMIADALGTQPRQVAPLADIVFEKTGGNPFFTIQFVSALADEDLLAYDAGASAWRWHIDRIQARQVGDNVVDLMIERLSRLPDDSLQALKQLACLGNSVEIASLRHVLGTSGHATQDLFHEALRSGLLLQVDEAYAFAHDRFHEAAYVMVPERARAQTHRRIGLRLLQGLSEAEIDAQIFDIVSQFNRGDGGGGVAANERTTTASLNLRAGRKAKASAAYAAACGYLLEGGVRLGDEGWRTHYALAFALALEHAECTFLSGAFDRAEKMIADVLAHAQTDMDAATIHRLKIELHVVRSENQEAVESGLAALRRFGIDLSPHPTWGDVQREYDDIWKNLNGRPIETFTDLPAMNDPRVLATMPILAALEPPTYFTDFNLMTLVVCRLVNLSLIHGAADASNQGFAFLGWLMGPAFGRYEDGYRVARLASEQASKRKVLLDMGRVNHNVGQAALWTQSLGTSVDWFRLAYRTSVEAGDVYFATYSSSHVAFYLLLQGHDLQQDAEECRECLEFARGIGFRDGADLIVSTERTIASLRGLTRGLSDFNDDGFDEAAFEAALTATRMNVVVYWYWTRKIMLHFLAGNHPAALAAAEKVQPGPWVRIVQVQHMDYHYYTALSLAARIGEVPPGQRQALRERLEEHGEQLRVWAAETRSPTFSDKHVLISAEIARLEGRELEAERLYEKSIGLARQNGFLQNEGIANELAARFHAARGFDTIASAYLREARHCYLRWGAHGKVRQLDASHPHALAERRAPDSTATMMAPVEHLDLATVIKVSQAVSGEIVLEKLIDTLMRTAIEHAGAERAMLMLARGTEHCVEAEATTKDEAVTVRLRDASVAAAEFPESIVQYVARTGESVILDDALSENPFSADTYIRRRRTRSLLCVPLLHQAKLIGMLYLENNLAAHVFTAKRLSTLKLLASQAAVSLENSRLYSDLEEREARIRRLVDANIIGIVIWNLDGRLIDANDAFLRMVRYEREDLNAGLRWTDMTPEDSWEASAAGIRHLVATGEMPHHEKEFFRKDGTRVPVLIGAAAFDGTRDQGVAFILDLTERKQAEERVREGERRYRDLQSELTHANRVATMGQLSAWIAHDVKQPLVSIVTSGDAGLRWLAADPPNVEAARRAFDRIIRDGHRAAGILDKTRSMVKRALPRKEPVDMNEVITETMALVGAEAARKGIGVVSRLGENLPAVMADRIQIQQVILNLAVNAIEAMKDSASHDRNLLVVSEEDDSGDVKVAMHDTGPGLPMESSDRVFESFYTTKVEGMGMGLAICRTIVETYGGRIRASQNTPRGAVFQFALPGTRR